VSGPAIGCAIVTHQSARVVEGLLSSLTVLDPAVAVVVDHESTDGTPAILDAWRPSFAATVVRQENRGYAAGVNRAVRELDGHGVELVVVLNPDARVERLDRAGLGRLFATRPALGSACPLTLAAEPGRLDSLGLRLTPWAAAADHGQGQPAAWSGTSALRGVIGPCGGSAIYRMDALRSLAGPFDERFFLYYEDAQLALRLRAAGWTTVTTDLLTVRHERAGLGARNGGLGFPAARLAAVERQRSYELFVADAPLPLGRRVAGRVAAFARGRIVRHRLRRAGLGG
jgi:GT2 family glycosyltransferase